MERMKTTDLVKALKICPYKADEPIEKPQYCLKYQCRCFEFVRSGKCERMNKTIKEFIESGK